MCAKETEPDFSNMEDLELIEFIQKPELWKRQASAAEAELVDRYSEKTRWHIKSAANDLPVDLHEDIFSEAAIAILETLRNGKFDLEKGIDVSGYIYGIVRRQIQRSRRSRARRLNQYRAYQEEKVQEGDGHIFYESVSDAEEVQKIHQERVEQIQLALKHLKPKHSKVLILRFDRNKRMKEIARKLGITEQQAIDRCRYAITLLKKRLKIEKIGFYE